VNKDGNMFRCIVEDNGIGRKQSAVFKPDEATKKGIARNEILRSVCKSSVV